MINLLKNNTFVKNVATLITGTAISQALLFFFTPILTRIYSPEEFGFFAIYVAIVAVISTFTSLKYDIAIMLPKENADAQALFFLSIFLTLFISFLSLIVCIILKLFFAHVDFVQKIDSFIWILPPGILFLGLFQIFFSFSSRNKFFSTISFGRVGQSGSALSFQIGMKLAFSFSKGLIIGNLLGSIVALIILLIKNLKEKRISLQEITIKRIYYNAKHYQNFPKYQSIQSLINALSQNLPVILLTVLYSPEIAGFYALTQRILAAPTALISESTRQVYYQKASELYSQKKDIKAVFKKTTLSLVKIGVIPFLVIGILAPGIFSLFFGTEWQTSGVYAQMLILWSFLLFINPPTVSNIFIIGLQKFYLKFEIISVCLRVLSIILPFWIFNNHYYSVFMFSLASISLNIFLILYITKKIFKR